MNLTFVTGNENKRLEVEAILCASDSSFTLVSQKIDLPELQGRRAEIASRKCELAAQTVRGPVLTEDTSLCFVALNELPGPYIKVCRNNSYKFSGSSRTSVMKD
jgi:inosine triphosphate pyrophosphatase